MATKNNIVGMVHVKHGDILPFSSYFINYHNSTETKLCDWIIKSVIIFVKAKIR